MLLEDYFDFLTPEDIRIKESRIGIETVLYDFIHRARRPEEIAADYPTVSLEQVYATVLYYLHNREAVSSYLAAYLEYCERVRREAAEDRSPGIERLRRIKAQLEGLHGEAREAELRRILQEERQAHTATASRQPAEAA
jgi:uncharacterized protein (DUF433 family)